MKSQRAALYHRVSTLDQDVTLARTELRGAAGARGFEVVLDIEETGSGAKNDRPGLQQILEAARRGKLDVVLVWKLDRFGRSVLDVLSNVEQLQRAGVCWIVVTQGLEIRPAGDAVSKLLLTMLAGVAEFERDLIRERTRAALRRKKELGVQLGPPFVQVDAAQVIALRGPDPVVPLHSWAQIARLVGCKPTTARRTFERARLATKGISKTTPNADGTGGPL